MKTDGLLLIIGQARKLLLHKKEIDKIDSSVAQKGYALIPLRLDFNERGYVKVEIALGKGKRFYDKREDVKKRTIERALRRTLGVKKR